MSIFKKLFSKQPGGSIVGNIIRGAVSSATGGLINPKIPNGGTQANQNQFAIGQAVGNPIYQTQVLPQVDKLTTTIAQNLPNSQAFQDAQTQLSQKVAKPFLQKYWYLLLLIPFPFLILFYVLRQKQTTKRRY